MTKRRKLSVLLTLYAVFSLLLALGVFAGGKALGDYIVNHAIYTKQSVLET